MDFKQIEAFISVSKLKSFSKAANSIYLSQPTISSHILTLEKELNIQLFDRNSKEVNLTPAGKCFLDYAVDIINTRDNAISSLCAFNESICGRLTLSASSTPCSTIVPELVSEFGKLHPDVYFNIIEQSSGEVIKDIVNFNSEIGFVGSFAENDKIKSYRLLEDTLVLISNNSLMLPDAIAADELKNFSFILRKENSATRKTFENALSFHDLSVNQLKISCEVNNLDTLLQFVRAGLGVSIVSKHTASEFLSAADLKITIIKNLNLSRSIYLILNSKRTLTPTAQAFVKLCKSHFNIYE
jgi:DNA-binding transcriptional LysR family regulator